ncbi:MAG TPA: tRNA (adenosine(37)-N6)-threonylcarbamoyltransferase complex dimerization subunit type 1 TsaB [Verrucomicrobiae bacterium]|nr:tRNA (adenosine(37)-N6)-threonylcarbamoyltransferase complex dimerization subunit type 1 TsaB [Verrucomicrobiae bacterium]
MKILALEFSSEQRSVAVVEDGTVLGEACEKTGKHTQAFALMAAALAQAGIEREQIECVAVGLGPGSYMGTRIAIAIAQGWQLARGVKTAGVSSAEAVARQGAEGGPAGPEARTIARLAHEKQAFVPADTLEPIYSRPANFVKAPPPRTIM